MKTNDEVETLERLIGQLSGLHTEISQLAKKSPDGVLNAFKLKLVNKIIAARNAILSERYRPFEDFEQFDTDDMPTNSDVTMILTQYTEQSERYRSDNVIYEDEEWFYKVNGRASKIKAAEPTKVGEK
jgi:uncharacterized phage infection (PIP) family protein YhgE